MKKKRKKFLNNIKRGIKRLKKVDLNNNIKLMLTIFKLENKIGFMINLH